MDEQVERVARALLIRRLGSTSFSDAVLQAMPLEQFGGHAEAVEDAKAAIAAMQSEGIPIHPTAKGGHYKPD